MQFIPAGYDNKESEAFMKDPTFTTGMTIYRTGDLYEQHEEISKVQPWASYLRDQHIPDPQTG